MLLYPPAIPAYYTFSSPPLVSSRSPSRSFFFAQPPLLRQINTNALPGGADDVDGQVDEDMTEVTSHQLVAADRYDVERLAEREQKLRPTRCSAVAVQRTKGT